MAKVDVKCPFCEQTESVKKHGLGKAGHQRYRCQMCCLTFQLDYAYSVCHPGMGFYAGIPEISVTKAKSNLACITCPIPRPNRRKFRLAC